MSVNIAGSWRLLAWRRLEGDSIVYPLGEDVTGTLIYAEDGSMAVQMMTAHRPTIPTTDPLDGDTDARAAAYSTCLAYFGTWKVEGSNLIHHIEASLFPNWSATTQIRPFTYDGQELVLRTPPEDSPKGIVVNEISWVRQRPASDS